MRGMTTIIITQCDKAMLKGDYLQYPNKDPFEVPAYYSKIPEKIRKERFWKKIMHPGLPFDFAKGKNFHIKPICWTNEPETLAYYLEEQIEFIDKT